MAFGKLKSSETIAAGPSCVSRASVSGRLQIRISASRIKRKHIIAVVGRRPLCAYLQHLPCSSAVFSGGTKGRHVANLGRRRGVSVIVLVKQLFPSHIEYRIEFEFSLRTTRFVYQTVMLFESFFFEIPNFPGGGFKFN